MIFKTTTLYNITVLGTSYPADSNSNSEMKAYKEIKSAAMIYDYSVNFSTDSREM